MKSDAISFHHPVAFWSGCALLVAGVLSHVPMLAMGAHMHYRLVGMPMDTPMLIGMALIPLGLALAVFGLMPRVQQLRALREPLMPSSGTHPFVEADGTLTRAHWTLVLVLLIALAVDVMKPALLGFVMPGMSAEYGIDTRLASLLAVVALTGTALGSLMWGRLADVFGRRAAILLSALMFAGTSICGAMPAFGWNLGMCFLMGLSAGGLLPITFTLMAEIMPARQRGWLLVALGGVGSGAGYLLAAGAAALLEERYSWRSLWLLGLPTGALIIVLNHWIPESPRFLSSVGLERAAQAVLRRFSAHPDATSAVATETSVSWTDTPALSVSASIKTLFAGRYATLTLGMVAAGVAWGLTTFGFVLWLPVNLIALGVNATAVNTLLASAALLALPGVLVVVFMYHVWSTIRTLVTFALLTALSLLAFAVIIGLHLASQVNVAIATAALLVSSSGVIATLIPYAAEIYPVRLRGSGAGLIAASSKFGGILGAGMGLFGFFEHMLLAASFIAVAMTVAAVMLLRSGVETRGVRLENIQLALQSLHQDGTSDRAPTT